MRRKVEIVAAATELLEMVIFCGHLAVYAGLEIASHSESLAVHFGKFSKTVTVMIITVLLSVLAEDRNTHLVVICHKRGIQRGVVIEHSPAIDTACSM